MKVALFGQTGQVATEVQRRCPGDVTLEVIGRDRADFSKADQVFDVARGLDVDAVINAVAYTAVDKAEVETALAHTINGASVGRLAEGCAKNGTPLVHISTDYVFPGNGDAPWTPDDASRPLGAYGASKLMGEEAIRAVGGIHVILRTSWVFSAHGNNFVKTMLRLGAERDALTIVCDEIGGPTPASSIADACLDIVRGLVQGSPGGTYHFSGKEDVSWADFAREIFQQAGLSPKVVDTLSADYHKPEAANRPLNSRMDCSTLLQDFGIARPSWRNELYSVLKDLDAW